MLTPYVPYPPSSGGQIRTLNLLKYLAKNHKITLVSLYKNDDEKKYISHLKKYCERIYLCKRSEKPWAINNIFRAVFSILPFLIIRNYSPQAKEIIKQLLEENSFDVIHAETFYIMPHIPQTRIPIFLLEQTIEYEVYQHFISALPVFLKFFFYFDILKLKYWERYYWRKAFLVGTVSESDKRLISKIEPGIHPVVVPNGAGDELIAYKLTKKDLTRPVALFLGNFSWLQNTEAANFLIQKIYPKLIASIPHLRLIIAGQKAQNKIKIPRNTSISIVDIKSDDIRLVKKMYESSTLFVGPIFGPGGTRLKILAAMATGLPVIATKTGLAGLLIKDTYNVLVAETPDDFVIKIQEVLSDEKLYENLRTNAHQLVNEIYNWKKIAQKLEIVYARIKRNENRN